MKIGLFLALLTSGVTQAGQFHYKDLLIGERATGLGGAFVAISDDPSGIYHNPAGILFGLENYISVSANGYTASNQIYENIYPGQDYKYRSESLVPVLFGFTQNYKKDKFGFAVIVPNSDLIDQNDTVTKEAASGEIGFSFRRKFFRQDSTYLAGPAYATELMENCSIGFSLLGMLRTVKIIDNIVVQYDPVGNGKYFTHLFNLNRTNVGTIAKIGLQIMPLAKLSVGLTVEKPFNISGSGSGNKTQSAVDPDTGLPPTLTGTFNHDMTDQAFSEGTSIPTNLSSSLGLAYFFSREFLIAAQLDYHAPQQDYPDFPIGQTINWSVGTEFFLTDGVAVRAGLYSNGSKTLPVDPNSATTQPPYVNHLGLALGASVYRSGTSLSLSTSYVTGKGEGKAFENSTLVQTVTETNLGIYLSGSYQL